MNSAFDMLYSNVYDGTKEEFVDVVTDNPEAAIRTFFPTDCSHTFCYCNDFAELSMEEMMVTSKNIIEWSLQTIASEEDKKLVRSRLYGLLPC